MTEQERPQIGEILADFEQDHNADKAVKAIQDEITAQEKAIRKEIYKSNNYTVC